MEKQFNTVLIASFLVELLAAVSLILGPEGIQAAGSGEQWMMHYGFAALAMASISLWAWPGRKQLQVVTTVLGILLTFHTGLTLSLALAGDQPAGLIMHSVLAVLCLVLFVRRAAWCVAAESGESDV